MTKKDLEKEAEIFVSEKADKGNFDVEKFGKAYFSESSMKQALVKFAEKQIAELEAQIEKMKCCGNCIHCKYDENEDSYEWCEVHDQIVNIAIQPCSEYEIYNFDKAIKEIKEK